MYLTRARKFKVDRACGHACSVTQLCPTLRIPWIKIVHFWALHTPLSKRFPSQEYWSGLPFLLDPRPQGIFLTQGLHPGLLNWQVDSLSLSHLGSLYWAWSFLKKIKKKKISYMWISAILGICTKGSGCEVYSHGVTNQYVCKLTKPRETFKYVSLSSVNNFHVMQFCFQGRFYLEIILFLPRIRNIRIFSTLKRNSKEKNAHNGCT